MRIPATIPHIKTVFVVVGVLAIGWIALEGDVGREIVMAMLIGLPGLAYLVTRLAQRTALGGRRLSMGRWLLLMGVAGVLAGAGVALMTLFLMALKTGLHAHGPEYSAGEIAWVWAQLPLWAAVGGLAGLGVGALAAAGRRN